MILSSPRRKRSRDVEDDFDLTTQPLGKKSRASTATDSPLSISVNKTQWHFLQSPLQTHRSAYASEDDSINSNASEAGSMTDDSMDLDLEDKARLWSPDPAALLTPTTLPSWSSRGSISDDISTQNTPRKSEGIVVRPTRPKIYPLQSQSLRSDMTYRRHGYDYMAGSSMSITTDRLPSSIDDNEPHTPTTAAGSQLSLLSVNDMDVDSGSVTPVRQGSDNGSFMRRQRQRSGAFISPPEVAKKIQFGYRADCEKCRNKVPGHMNHFVDP